MKIILADIDERIVNAYRRHCERLENVSFHHGSILDLDVKAVVSPANSFGFMDGGIDAVYTRFFGRGVQNKLQEEIAKTKMQELLVGQAMVIETGHEKIPYVISAPTMRVPQRLPANSVNVYLAARAALHAAEDAGLESVAFPGLGTGVGNFPPDTCGLQMHMAIRSGIIKHNTYPKRWKEAQDDHQRLYGDRIVDLQHED